MSLVLKGLIFFAKKKKKKQMKKYVCYYFFPFLCGVCNQILTNNVLPVFPRIATSRNSLFLKVKFITLHMPKH